MTDAWLALEGAAGDRSSGAGEIARAAAEAIARLPAGEVPAAVDLLLRGHASMAPLWRLATEVAAAGAEPSAAAARFLRLLARDAEAPAALAPLLPDAVLTISWSSAVREAVRARRPGIVRCMASEPGGEGHRLAEALAGVAQVVEVVEDEDAIGRVPAEAVVVGADAVTAEGVVNKVKTRALLASAAARGVPRYVVAGESKFLADRPPLGPVFELAPLDLLSAVASPAGLLTPADAARLAARARVHPDLRPLLAELGGIPAGPAAR